MYRDWRIMGLWRGGRVFLVVMGTSKWDCLDRLPDALSAYTFKDLKKIESIWLEWWEPGSSLRWPEWIPLEEISRNRLTSARAWEWTGLRGLRPNARIEW
jgi:hypothetical protein